MSDATCFVWLESASRRFATSLPATRPTRSACSGRRASASARRRTGSISRRRALEREPAATLRQGCGARRGSPPACISPHPVQRLRDSLGRRRKGWDARSLCAWTATTRGQVTPRCPCRAAYVRLEKTSRPKRLRGSPLHSEQAATFSSRRTCDLERTERLRRPQARRTSKCSWCADGLRLANKLRLGDISLTKSAIAVIISKEVTNSPRNLENIAGWLRKWEKSGELASLTTDGCAGGGEVADRRASRSFAVTAPSDDEFHEP